MRVSTRWWLGLVLLAIPALLFIPGIGPLESAGPSALARRTGGHETWYYRVQPGDVLSRIAERELGTLVRYEEILRLNPGLQPRKMLPGTVLRMPPRVPGEAVATPPARDVSSTSGPGARDLLLSCAALLALLGLVIFTAGRLERRRHGEA